MDSWYYKPGHRWRYDTVDVPFGMEMRFPNEGLAEDGACACPCGRCSPEGEHLADDGCSCRVLGCFCLEPSAA